MAKKDKKTVKETTEQNDLKVVGEGILMNVEQKEYMGVIVYSFSGKSTDDFVYVSNRQYNPIKLSEEYATVLVLEVDDNVYDTDPCLPVPEYEKVKGFTVFFNWGMWANR